MARPVLRSSSDAKAPGMIRFVCLSDTHSQTDYLRLPPGDVLLHSGDFSLQGDPEEIQQFNTFLQSLPYAHKVVIAGNHDLTFDLQNFSELRDRFRLRRDIDARTTKELLRNCTYLEDSGTFVCGYSVWGSPWTPTFFDWGFNLPIGPAILAKWDLIPSNTDILLTHGPPYDILDRCSDGYKAGCPLLAQKIQAIKPLVHLFGHIHEAYGTRSIGETLYVNGSNCDLGYRPVQAPIIFDLPDRS